MRMRTYRAMLLIRGQCWICHFYQAPDIATLVKTFDFDMVTAFNIRRV